jgi:hypothetical protein
MRAANAAGRRSAHKPGGSVAWESPEFAQIFCGSRSKSTSAEMTVSDIGSPLSLLKHDQPLSGFRSLGLAFVLWSLNGPKTIILSLFDLINIIYSIKGTMNLGQRN